MGINKTYRLYVFDLDGTLADTKEDIGRAMLQVIREAGLKEPDEAEVKSAIGGGAKKALQRLSGLEDDVIGPHLSKFMEVYEDMCCDNVTLYEGAGALLRGLKAQGAKLALVTMKFRSAVDKIIKALDIDIFDVVVAFEDAKKRKPDPDTLLLLLRKFRLSPDMALMVGDSETDMAYAKAAGVDFCVMEHGYGDMPKLAAEGPAYTLKGFFDF